MQAAATVALLPFFLGEYFHPATGRAYGITTLTKLRLAARVVRTTVRVQSASNFVTHLLMATQIMKIAPDRPGVISEGRGPAGRFGAQTHHSSRSFSGGATSSTAARYFSKSSRRPAAASRRR